jgi:hypothetical protein
MVTLIDGTGAMVRIRVAAVPERKRCRTAQGRPGIARRGKEDSDQADCACSLTGRTVPLEDNATMTSKLPAGNPKGLDQRFVDL